MQVPTAVAVKKLIAMADAQAQNSDNNMNTADMRAIFEKAISTVVAVGREKCTIARLRSVFEFVGIGEAAPFAMPAPHLIKLQLYSNLNYFATNYLALSILVAVGICLYYPSFLFWTAAIASGWYAALFAQHRPIVIMDCQITTLHKTVAMTALTVIVAFLWCFWQIFLILLLSAIFIGAHAATRESRTRATEIGPDTQALVPPPESAVGTQADAV